MSVTNDRGRLVMIIAGGLAIAVVVIWVLVNAMTPKIARKTTDVDMTLKPQSEESLTGVTRENTSAAYVDDLETRNRQQAFEAARRGEGHIDRLTDGYETTYTTPFDPTLLEKQMKSLQEEQERLRAEQMRLANTRGTAQRPKGQTEDHYVARDGVLYMSESAVSAENAAFQKQFDRLLAANSQPVSGNASRGVSRVTGEQDKQRAAATFAASGQNTSLGGQPIGPNSQAQRTVEVIKADDNILPAKLNLGLNTDIGGVASATIVGGDYHGTVLTANRFTPSYKHLVIEFNRFCLPDGRCGTINAVAVDLEQGVAAVKGDYKSRIGLRLGGSVMASILEGYGRAISSNLARDTISINDQIIVTNNEPITSKEALRASSLEAGSTLGAFFRQISNRPAQVSKPMNAMIGIFIVRPGAVSIDPTANTALAVSNATYSGSVRGAPIRTERPEPRNALEAMYEEELLRQNAQSRPTSGGLQ